VIQLKKFHGQIVVIHESLLSGSKSKTASGDLGLVQGLIIHDDVLKSLAPVRPDSSSTY